MNSLTVKLIFYFSLVPMCVQGSDYGKSPLGESLSSEGLTYSLVSFPCTPKKNVDCEYELPITPRAARPVLEVGSLEELAAYEASRNERLADRLENEDVLRQRQALRRASDLSSPYRHYSAEEMDSIHKAKKESFAKQVRRDRQALGYCSCCVLGLILLSNDATNDSTLCMPTSAKYNMPKYKMA